MAKADSVHSTPPISMPLQQVRHRLLSTADTLAVQS
jgi:hypothetical protein